MAAGFSLSAPVSTLRTGRAEIGDHMMRSWDQWPQSPEAPAEEHHTMASWERPCLTAGNLATILHRNNNIANAAKCWSWPNVHWNSISLKSAILPILPINSWSSWWFECFRFWLLIVLRYSNGPQTINPLSQREQMSCRLVSCIRHVVTSHTTNRKEFSVKILGS